ncbi:MAG: IS110 family transposase [Candidatus Marinimicrobia bacterium]|jgi:transposase|nr:IS110 family transposase [Candidatus Neomarinimicrobiota bacterium]
MDKYYLGIDASKGYADFVLISENLRIIEKAFRLNDTFDGHNKLFEIISHYIDYEIYAGIESTGGFENNWYHMLKKVRRNINIKVARINPYAVHHSAKANMRRVTTDKISAMNIAEYMIAHKGTLLFEDHDSFKSLRSQWKYVALLNKQRTQIINQLHSLLYASHPQLLKHCRDVINQWILKLLIQYPTAKQLSRARISTVAKIPYLSERRAASLVNDAKRTVASSTDNISAQLIKNISSKLLDIESEISEQFKLIRSNCDLPEVELLTTFVGIGEKAALGLIMEIGAIERFSSAKKMASFFGLHPVFKISGDGIGGVRMSKHGRKEPRKILFLVSLTAITSNEYIRTIYLSSLEKGMSKMAAIGKIMHKIMRIIYGMLRTQTAYDPAIDQFNRNKEIKVKQKINNWEDYRYQVADNDAPISNRQYKKRKRQKESQLVNQ